MRTKVLLCILIGTVLLLSVGIGIKDAKADALLFPWIVKSAGISTIISVVNTAETDIEAAGVPIPGYHNNKIQRSETLEGHILNLRKLFKNV